MKQKQDDIYIKILSFGKQNLGRPFKFVELKKYLKDEGYEYDDYAVTQLFMVLFTDKKRPSGNHPGGIPPDDGEFFLKHNGYFNLLEHEELLSARKSSLYATIFASIAIIISIISAATSIYFSNAQLNKPITIEQPQFEKLANNSTGELLKKIQSTQNDILIEIKAMKSKIIKQDIHNKTVEPIKKP